MSITTRLESEVTGAAQSVEDMLVERGSQYGDFFSHASITQGIKGMLQSDSANWHKLEDDQKEALEMVAHKIGRIINGNHNLIDSWKDIAGYVTLVVQRLEGEDSAEDKGDPYAVATAPLAVNITGLKPGDTAVTGGPAVGNVSFGAAVMQHIQDTGGISPLTSPPAETGNQTAAHGFGGGLPIALPYSSADAPPSNP